MNPAAREALYAALSWGMLAFVLCLSFTLWYRPADAPRAPWASLAFKLALVGGTVTGVLALALGAGFFWRW